MLTSIKARLNTARCNKDSMYPLGFQLLRGGAKKIIPLGISLKKEWFNAKTERVTALPAHYGGKARTKTINEQLDHVRKVLEQITTNLQRQDPSYTVAAIVESYNHSQDKRYLTAFIREECIQLEAMGHLNTASQYKSLQNSILRHRRDAGLSENVLLEDITESFIVGYRKYLELQGMKSSTVSTYLSNLRAVYNKASKAGIAPPRAGMFRGNIPHAAPTEKRAVSAALIRYILDAPLKEHPELIPSRDIFAASIYLEGMAVRDIMNLKRENLKENVITYRRSKTDKILSCKVIDELQVLLDKYATDDSHLFPFLLSDSRHSHKDYRTALRRLNRHLHKLEKILEIPFHLTTYVARHSWASLAQECNTPIEKISQALGHTSPLTTQIYLKAFNRSVIDEVNETVINCVRKEREKPYFPY